MNLFDKFASNARQEAPPEQYRSEFEYLNRTGLLRPMRVRAFLEKAFGRYSGDENEFLGRFRSRDNAQHVAAAFELVVHELLWRRGLQPSSAQIGNGRPDNRIRLSSGSFAIVEARTTQPYNNSHYLQAIDAIDSVKRQGIRLDVMDVEEPTENFSKAKLKQRLAAFLAQLDTSCLPKEFERSGPHFQFDEGGGSLKVYPIRKKGWKGGVGFRDDFDMADDDDIRSALKSKKGKYPSVAEPYILAICAAKAYSSERHFVEALFRESRGAGKEDLRGLWAKGGGSRVSAVLACYSFKPSSIAGARLQLFVNPTAGHPLGPNPFGCEQVVPGPDGYRTAGASLRELLKLPRHWPSRAPHK
ncbi:MAG: hypothetical protein ABL956_10840 [Hyphomonadaceae bacterium]